MSPRPPNPWGLWVLLAIGVLALLAALAVGGSGRSMETANAGPSTFSQSAVGYRALYRFLSRSGLNLRVGLDSRDRSKGSKTAFFLAEPRNLVTGEIGPLIPEARLREALDRKAPLILVLPKWREEPDLLQEGWARKVSLIPHGDLEDQLKRLQGLGLNLRSIRLPEAAQLSFRDPDQQVVGVAISSVQLLESDTTLKPVIASDSGTLIAKAEATARRPEVWVIADPDLLNNAGIGRADHAAVIDALFFRWLEPAEIIFDEMIHGFSRHQGWLTVLTRPPLGLLVGAGLVFLVLAAWGGAARFQPAPRAERPVSSGTVVELAEGAELLAWGGARRDAMKWYAALCLEEAAEHHGKKLKRTDPSLMAAQLDSLLRQGSGTSWAELGKGMIALFEKREPALREMLDIAGRFRKKIGERNNG